MFARNVLKRRVPLLARVRKSTKLPKHCKCIYPPYTIRTLTCSSVSTLKVSSNANGSHFRSKKIGYFNGPNKTLKQPSTSAGGPLSGQYDPFLVNVALFRVVTDKHANTTPLEVLHALTQHFEAFPERVADLADSIYSFYAQLKPLHSSDAVPYVVVNLFRTYVNAVSVLAETDLLAAMVPSVSRTGQSNDLLFLVKVLSAYGRKRKVFLDLYCKGVGTVLPELQTLTMEFDFAGLRSISPVLNKISGLVSEFDMYIAANGNVHSFDANSLRLLVNVLRYQRLYEALVSRSSDNLLAADLLSISKDGDAEAVQTQLGSLSGDQREIDNLIFSVHRNFFNAIYLSTGLVKLDVIFAFLNREAEKDCYTPTEKQMIHDFVNTFLPLACRGLLQLGVFSQVKYACLPARHEDDIIVPFEFTDNIFDNYELSLAILFRVPSRFHLILLVKPQVFNASSPLALNKLLNSIREYFATSSYLLKADSQELIRVLIEMDHFLLRGTTILNKLASTPNLVLVARAQTVLCSTVDTMEPSIIDLSQDLCAEPSPVKTTNNIRINDREIADYKRELNNFRLIDLNNEKYVDIGTKSFLKYLEERMRYIAKGKHLWEASAVSAENAELFVQLYELLAASYDVGLTLETQLDSLADEFTRSLAIKPSKPQYVQIPDDLKLHDLHAEIEIFRNDELQSPYSSLSLDEILTRLQTRTEELMKENPTRNGNPRMTSQNVLRFKKLLSRLRLLFAMNGGNTEVLDALVKSQDVFSQLESKIISKNKLQPAEVIPTESPSQFSGPYLQIPDNLQLHEYLSELIEFKELDLGSGFKDCSAEKIILILEQRIDGIIKGLPSDTRLAITKDNFRVFATLLSRLNKLFVLNGGYTAILDTMIHFHSAFDKFESNLTRRKDAKVSDSNEVEGIYSELPDDVLLEEYYEELSELKLRIGVPFGSVNVDTVLSSLESMKEEQTNLEKKIVLGKLFLNLKNLFKLNNNHTFVLDNVLLSAENFDRVEKEINNVAATENIFVMPNFSNTVNTLEMPDDDYVLSLLVNKEKAPTSDTETTIESALRNAMDPKPSAFVEEAEVFTHQEPLKATVTPRSESGASAEKYEPVDKQTLEKFLKKAKYDNETKLERQWRERKAYEWSSGMVNGNGSLESRTFFDPLFAKSARFPMFPLSRKREHDFLVLTSSGATFTSVDNPLGSSHVPEDMFDILEKLSEGELAKFSKSLKKLQKKEWKLIGGGGNGGEKLLVLRRGLQYRSNSLWTRVKSLLGAVIIVFFTLIGLNYWLEEKKVARDDTGLEDSPESKSSTGGPHDRRVISPVDLSGYKQINRITEPDINVPSGKDKNWKLILWR